MELWSHKNIVCLCVYVCVRVCECVCVCTCSVHHFTLSPVLSESYYALWDSVMDALEGMREAPFLFGQHEEGQVTFAEAVGRLTREQCWTFAVDIPLQEFWGASQAHSRATDVPGEARPQGECLCHWKQWAEGVGSPEAFAGRHSTVSFTQPHHWWLQEFCQTWLLTCYG